MFSFFIKNNYLLNVFIGIFLKLDFLKDKNREQKVIVLLDFLAGLRRKILSFSNIYHQ